MHDCLIQVTCLIEVATKTGFTVHMYMYVSSSKVNYQFYCHRQFTMALMMCCCKIICQQKTEFLPHQMPGHLI